MQQFDAAPWPASVKAVSALGIFALGGATYALYRAVPRGTRVPFAETFGTFLQAIPLVVLLGALLFVVNGYEVEAGALRVRRLLWSTSLPLEGLEAAWHDPAAMCRSLRLFGNGGLFGVTGIFQNATLGRYRAFVTDPKQAVVLRFATRVVVVSPAFPRAFLGELQLVVPGLSLSPPPAAP